MSISNKFLNVFLDVSAVLKSKKGTQMKKPSKHNNQEAVPENVERDEHPNSYVHYIDPVSGYKRADVEMNRPPAHQYTLHLVRSVFNEEIF